MEKRLAEAVLAYLKDAHLKGHIAYCGAICGPYSREWTDDSKCDCERKNLIGVLKEMGYETKNL